MYFCFWLAAGQFGKPINVRIIVLPKLKAIFWRGWHFFYVFFLLMRIFRVRNIVNEKYVTYVATAGMGNRLRAHLIALAISKKTGRKLVVYWPKNQHCGASYSELFEHNFLSKCHFFSIKLLNYEKGNYSDQADRMPFFSEGIIVLDESWQYVDFEYLIDSIKELDIVKEIKPLVSIQKSIEMNSTEFNAGYIGMHIRRGDFLSVGQSIPLSRYVIALEEEIAADCNSKIYIASDANRDELSDLFTNFSHRIVKREVGARDSVDGMKDAVIDMFLLAGAKKIILTRGSTFGELAAILGKNNYRFA